MGAIYGIGGMVLIILIIVGLAIFFEYKRRQEMETLARQFHFRFFPKDESGLLEQLEVFDLFTKGHSREIRNIMERRIKSRDILMRVFDYRYVTGSGKNSSTYNQTVIYFQSEHLHLPQFILHPESIFHKIGEAFGFKDIDFPAYPAFSKHYRLVGKPEARVRGAFTPPILTFLEQEYTQKRRWWVEGQNHELIVYRKNKRASAKNMVEFMKVSTQIFDYFVETGTEPS
ncbi:MAG: hypothetical protein D6675_13225 [Gemmatimonadetes bacterium]|nr:MAG: hypothetical protein D6675_13225 [Gemmatimonadota bacterium]